MPGWDQETFDTAMREKEVELTTWGRKTGKPGRVILWVWGEAGRLFIRSGRGMGRDWPQNMLANGRGILHLAGRDIPVRGRHVTDPGEARAGITMANRKYNTPNRPSPDDGPLSPAEQATFELTPDDGAASGS